jgi:tRNA-specific 2-thiouridylase
MAQNLNKNKVIIAISGGVDSAAAAGLLCKAGYEVTGVYFCLQNSQAEKSQARACCSPNDAADARKIASKLGIDFSVLDVNEDFEKIKEHFALSYAQGRTPNPCILCNQNVKFKRLLEFADSIGAYFIATGHYAKIVEDNGSKCLYRAKAFAKDQSYVLFGLHRSIFDRIIFPLGDMDQKQSVRQIAQQANLSVYDKPESQEICFAPQGDYRSVLQGRADKALLPGPIFDTQGKKIGSHDGYGLFTIGQRKGIKIAAAQPLYVREIDPLQSSITVAPREELMSKGLYASSANWLCDMPDLFHCDIQIRYNNRGASGEVRKTSDESFEVLFDEPVFAITSGQAAVLYDNQKVLGGGWITDAIRT